MSNFILWEIPLWLAFVSMFFTLLASIEVGYRTGIRKFRSSPDKHLSVETTKNDVTLGSLLALLGLMLAFTYAVELNRQEQRKQATVDEANAIETAFLVVDFGVEPGRTQLREALFEYAKTRTAFPEEIHSREDLEQLFANSLAVQTKLWPLTKTLIEESQLPGPIQASIISAMTEVFDADSRRTSIIYDRIPMSVVVLLFLIATLALGMAAYNSGLQGHLNRWRKAMFALVLSSLMMVIVDFEKPLIGLIHVSQAPIHAVIQNLEAELEREKR